MKHVAAPTDDLRERFILFLASKPADEYYPWADGRHCACGTFINEQLYDKVEVRRWYAPWLTRTIMVPNKAEAQMVWYRWNTLASKYQTYGALLRAVRWYELGVCGE